MKPLSEEVSVQILLGVMSKSLKIAALIKHYYIISILMG